MHPKDSRGKVADHRRKAAPSPRQNAGEQKPLFPDFVRLGKRNRYWKLSELLAYEAACAGVAEPDLPAPADERYLTAAQVTKRYNVSFMWIERQLQARAEAIKTMEAA